MPVTSRPSRAFVVMPLSAASVVLPSKHSPGPSPYIGWKWSKPQMPSKPSSSAKRALDASSSHGIRCCAMSSPNFMGGLLSRLALRGHEAAEVVGRERLDDGVDRGACGRRAPDPEERSELAEVPTWAHALHELFAAVGALAHQMDLAFLDHVRDVTVVALREEHGARGQHDPFRLLVNRPPARRELDDVIGEGQEAVVVGRDDHRPSGPGRLAQQ